MITTKTITVFGASGRVGRLVVSLALSEGYTVIAQVHKHSNLTDHPKLIIVQGDVHDPKVITESLRGSDAVISTLSSWGSPNKDVLSTAMNHVAVAMRGMGMSRIVSLTGADARARGDDLSIIHRLSYILIMIVGRKVLKDGEAHIQLLEQSDLDWTVIRSPVMSSAKSAVYRLSDKRPMPWQTISRSSVATALLNQLGSEHRSQEAPFIL